MARTRTIPAATAISLTACTCPCGQIVFRLHAGDGSIFAVAPMARAAAEAVLASLDAALHPSPETRFAATACQGNA